MLVAECSSNTLLCISATDLLRQLPYCDKSCRQDLLSHSVTGPTSPTTDPITTGAWVAAGVDLPVFNSLFVCWLVGWLTSQQYASVSQGRICSDNFTCCHTEIEVADQTFHLTQSQYTDTGPSSPSADPITPGAWQGSHWSTNV